MQKLFPAIVSRIRPPKGDVKGTLRGIITQTWYDQFHGVICLVKIIDGTLSKGDRIAMYHGGTVYDVAEVGMLFFLSLSSEILDVLLNIRKMREEDWRLERVNERKNVDPLPGLVTPGRTPREKLSCGQVGYVICGIRVPGEVELGDTFFPD